MKVPASVRAVYDEIRPLYEDLGTRVEKLIRTKLSPRWHYEGRVKELESYALKLETGREHNPRRPEDMYACTVVVENHARVPMAVEEIAPLFAHCERRPPHPDLTHMSSDRFGFEDLRLYVAWRDDASLPATQLEGIRFELQVKTFLQHAWSIATHDLIYKADDVSWAFGRVAYQAKAMLENAELSISEARTLAEKSTLLARSDRRTKQLRETIHALRTRWSDPGMLPKNVVGLANTVTELAETVGLSLKNVWTAVDEATANGRGAALLDVSPYGAILNALFERYATAIAAALATPGKSRVFVCRELSLPTMSPEARKRLVTLT